MKASKIVSTAFNYDMSWNEMFSAIATMEAEKKLEGTEEMKSSLTKVLIDLSTADQIGIDLRQFIKEINL